LDPDIYESTCADYAALLENPPERKPIAVSENRYEPLDVDSSFLEATTKAELLTNDFSPVARIESAVRMTHPLFADAPSDVIESEYWSHVDGILAQITPEECFLSVLFSDGTLFTVWPDQGAAALYPNPNREITVSTGSFERDLEIIRAEMDSRHDDWLRPLHVVDIETARYHDDVHTAYVSTELPEAFESYLDSSSETMKSARRTEMMAFAACFALSGLLGLIFSSWTVFGAGLIAAGFFLYAIHRWGQKMSEEVVAAMEARNED